MNLFEGRVTEDEPDYIRIDAPALGSEIYVGHGVSCAPNQRVWFAIRPEKMRLTRTRPEQPDNAFPGMIDDVAYMGNLSIFRVRLGNGTLVKVTRANLSRYDEEALTWDEACWISWDDTAGVVLTQ